MAGMTRVLIQSIETTNRCTLASIIIMWGSKTLWRSENLMLTSKIEICPACLGTTSPIRSEVEWWVMLPIISYSIGISLYWRKKSLPLSWNQMNQRMHFPQAKKIFWILVWDPKTILIWSQQSWEWPFRIIKPLQKGKKLRPLISLKIVWGETKWIRPWKLSLIETSLNSITERVITVWCFQLKV